MIRRPSRSPPFPYTTPFRSLSAGPVEAQVWQQTGSAPTFSLIGSAALTVTDTRPVPGVSGITPSSMDLATPPASFTITGNGFANLGFGLPMVNFMRGTTLLAQARATALTGSTTLTVPFPTPATSITPNLPGLSAGPVEAQGWQQTGGAPDLKRTRMDARPDHDTRAGRRLTKYMDLATPPASL